MQQCPSSSPLNDKNGESWNDRGNQQETPVTGCFITFPIDGAPGGVLQPSYQDVTNLCQFRGNFCNDRRILKPRSTLMQLTGGPGETTKPTRDERRSNRDRERP